MTTTRPGATTSRWRRDTEDSGKRTSSAYRLSRRVMSSYLHSTIASFLGGQNVSTFDMGGTNYNVVIQAKENLLHNLDSIKQAYVKNTDGKLVPLINLVKIKPVLKQNELYHYDRLRATKMGADLSPNYKLGQVVGYLNSHLPKLLPTNVKFAFTGAAKDVLDTSSNMATIFILAIIFIYLVLAAQFESFLDPFIILLAVPLSLVGALFSLKLVNGSINIYTSIGLVTLIGLISKHGILITSFANKLIAEGMDSTQALIKAASIRLRPILMTTAAMVFGALPLVFASGASSESRRQIGIVIVGGLLFGTFFSLIVVPVTYSYASKLKALTKRLRAGKNHQED